MAVDLDRERRRFTIKDYERMFETGILTDHDRVELIEGEVIEMSPIGDPHAAYVANLTRLLVNAVGDRAVVWPQGPVRIPPDSVPQPDLALLRPRSYVRQSATMADVLLAIEVSDTTLRFDRVRKMRLYARAGIPEYWIVNVNAEAVEIYRSPAGDAYTEVLHPGPDEHIAPATLLDAVIPIASIFL